MRVRKIAEQVEYERQLVHNRYFSQSELSSATNPYKRRSIASTESLSCEQLSYRDPFEYGREYYKRNSWADYKKSESYNDYNHKFKESTYKSQPLLRKSNVAKIAYLDNTNVYSHGNVTQKRQEEKVESLAISLSNVEQRCTSYEQLIQDLESQLSKVKSDNLKKTLRISNLEAELREKCAIEEILKRDLQQAQNSTSKMQMIRNFGKKQAMSRSSDAINSNEEDFKRKSKKYEELFYRLQAQNNQLLGQLTQLNKKEDYTTNIQSLLKHIETIQEINFFLASENDSQRCSYEKCLDDISKQIIQALISQSQLRDECQTLKQKVEVLENQNSSLKSSVGEGNPSKFSNFTEEISEMLLAQLRESTAKSKRLLRQSNAQCNEVLSSFKDSLSPLYSGNSSIPKNNEVSSSHQANFKHRPTNKLPENHAPHYVNLIIPPKLPEKKNVQCQVDSVQVQREDINPVISNESKAPVLDKGLEEKQTPFSNLPRKDFSDSTKFMLKSSSINKKFEKALNQSLNKLKTLHNEEKASDRESQESKNSTSARIKIKTNGSLRIGTESGCENVEDVLEKWTQSLVDSDDDSQLDDSCKFSDRRCRIITNGSTPSFKRKSLRDVNFNPPDESEILAEFDFLNHIDDEDVKSKVLNRLQEENKDEGISDRSETNSNISMSDSFGDE